MRPDRASADLYVFGPYRLDTSRRRLWRDGELVALTPKAIETLIALVARAGEIVEKQELLEEVWAGTFVTEDTLAQNISTLRKALEDTSERPAYIETVPRRGYRFVAPVTTGAPAPHPSPSPGAAPEAMVNAAHPGRGQRLPWVVATISCLMVVVAALILIIPNWRGVIAEPPTQFIVLPATGTILSPSASVLAVSPDGRHLAFLASSADGIRRVWLRGLDSVTPRELPGTDEALAPFWSWDSEYVGFFTGGKLKKTSRFGGPPMTLSDAPGREHGGTWNRGGIILFNAETAPNRSRLFRVSATGGPAVPVSQEGDSTEVWQGLPQFLPDDSHFLYVARTADGRSDIYAGNLFRPGRQHLLAADSQAVYSAPGYLLFHRGGTLFAQQFDATRQKLEREPVPVRTEAIGYNPAGGRAMFSVSETGVLAYRPAPRGQLEWLDRTGKVLATIGGPHSDWSPALSPDEKRFAISRFDPMEATRQIWILTPAGDTPMQLTRESGWDNSAVWSPDGSRIAFAAGRKPRLELRQKSSDGNGGEEVLVQEGGIPTHWSADGRFIVYQREGDLWVLPLTDPREPRRIISTPASERDGQLSPDGRWLAYSSDESGRFEVHVRAFDDRDASWRVSAGGGIEPRWRRDGKELFYLAPDGRLMAVSVKSGATFEAASPTTLFHTRTDGSGRLGIVGPTQYTVSADGQRFLVNQPPKDSAPPPTTVVLNWTALLSR